MKTYKILFVVAALVGASYAFAADATARNNDKNLKPKCCKDAAKNKTTCKHECCIAAGKKNMNCERCEGTNTHPAPAAQSVKKDN
jgi:hypothetical protein